jgi:hypothetical protein
MPISQIRDRLSLDVYANVFAVCLWLSNGNQLGSQVWTFTFQSLKKHIFNFEI